jgi:hypothetical protein
VTPNIPLIAWAPDADPTTPGVLVDVENMLPTPKGYAPEFELGVPSNWAATLPQECYGAAGLVLASGTYAVFIGAGIELYYTDGGALVNRSRTSGGAYSLVGANLPWNFAAFQNAVIAVNTNNATQATANHVTTAFSDLSGAPRAQTIAVQRNFVIVGNINDGAVKPDGWACSAIEDYTDWTPDIATQAAGGRLTATPGPIVRIIAFQDYVMAFKQRGVYRGQYVGAADNTWAWPVISTRVGLINENAVCEADGALYWVGLDGFYRFAGGGIEFMQAAPWRWLRAQLLNNDSIVVNLVQAVWDSVHRVVRFFFMVARSGFPGPYCLTYHIDSGRWGRADLRVQWAFTLPFCNVAVPDSAAKIGVLSVPGYINNGTLEIMAHTEAPAASSFTTGDIGEDDQAFALTRARARFLRAPTTSTMTHFHRMNLGDALTTGETVNRTDGKYDVSHAARWHRLKFSQTGRYEVSGFSVETPRAGKR